MTQPAGRAAASARPAGPQATSIPVPETAGEVGQRLDVAMGAQSLDAVTLRRVGDQVERAPADRSCGAENRDAARLIRDEG
jgi:hypothetical protein